MNNENEAQNSGRIYITIKLSIPYDLNKSYYSVRFSSVKNDGLGVQAFVRLNTLLSTINDLNFTYNKCGDDVNVRDAIDAMTTLYDHIENALPKTVPCTEGPHFNQEYSFSVKDIVDPKIVDGLLWPNEIKIALHTDADAE